MLGLILSAVAVALLTGLAWAIGFRSEPTLDAAEARSEIEGRLPGFRVADLALAENGRGAFARDDAGRVAVILPLGDGWLARHVPPGTRISHSDDGLHFGLGEPLLRDARLPVRQLPGWAKGLAG